MASAESVTAAFTVVPLIAGNDCADTTMRRLIAIGDIHGDLDALVRILIGAELIDLNGNWIASDADVVLMGDLNDRGPDSVAVMDLVMALESNAPEHRSSVAALLGNHELLVGRGDFRYVTAREVLQLERVWIDEQNGPNAVLGGGVHTPHGCEADRPW